MTPGFRQLLNRYAMLGFEHQLALMDVLGEDPDWRLSPREGTATFGTDRIIPIQVLGTRSEESNTWLWAWANESSGLPAKALEAAKKVKQTGKKRSIGELAIESLPLDNLDLDAHTVALVATAIAGLPAYFRFPYKGGALYAALDSPDLRLPEPNLERMAHVIRHVIERFDLDQRTAFTSYAEAHGAKVQGDKQSAIARWSDGRSLTANFDEQGKLVEVRTGGEAHAPSASRGSHAS